MLTREQWSHGVMLAGVVNGVNAPFCDTEEEPAVTNLQEHTNAIATIIAEQCGVMAIQDVANILNRALEIRQK